MDARIEKVWTFLCRPLSLLAIMIIGGVAVGAATMTIHNYVT